MAEQFNNPFFRKEEEYKRDFYPIKHYVHQTAYYLHVMTGEDLDVCSTWLKNKIKNKELEGFNDPIVEYLLRGDNYDREVTHQPLSKFIKDIIVNEEIMAPSMTTYKNVKKERSLLSVSIEANITKRAVAKKAMFAYEAEEAMAREKGDELAAEMFHSNWFFSEKTQTATKLSNNAISGMHNSAANPYFNPSSHSTLTSNCRMTSGYGNANNEKMLSGNRHYWSPNVTMCNIISIIANSDYEKIGKFIRENNFHIPTVDEVMSVIEYSSKLYWKDSVRRREIFDLVSKLNPLQRAAFVYTGDLYHIRKFNDSYVREFIRKLSSKVCYGQKRTKADMKSIFEDHLELAHHICCKEMKGKGKKYEEIENTEELSTLHDTAINVSKTMSEYSDFIDTFFMTDNIPASVPRFPDSIRRSALISDTDSTIFTVQEWQVWFHGKLSFDQEAVAVASTMIAIAGQSIGHVLAIMSSNAGISKDMLRKIAMKNEYYFPVLVPTRVAKHYYAAIAVQEGNVKPETEYEIKGVHLKSSNAPPFIMKEAKRMMKEIMDTVMAGKTISIRKILSDISIMENSVLKSLLKGEGTYFRGGQIQTLDSYKAKDTPQKTNYFHYMLWDEVFAPKYGSIAPPPYSVFKLSTCIDSPTLTQKWLAEMQDKALASRIKSFMVKYGRTSFATFQLPQGYVSQYGLPVEFQDAIGIRHMVANVCKVFYLILETLGYYGLNSKETNMVMDYYTAEPEEIEVIASKFIDLPEELFVESDEDETEEEEGYPVSFIS